MMNRTLSQRRLSLRVFEDDLRLATEHAKTAWEKDFMKHRKARYQQYGEHLVISDGEMATILWLVNRTHIHIQSRGF